MYQFPKLHNHFPNNAWLEWTTLLGPNPPTTTGEQTLSIATKEYLNSSEAPQKKFLWIFSNLSAIDLGMVNKDK